ncbi:MAG: DUF4837 family protein [Flavobacteriales bacterium]|nr:DUF4837 family protein [Flavobacteriales bacterium]
MTQWRSSRLLWIVLLIAACNVESDDRWQYDAVGEFGDVVVLTDQMTWGQHRTLIDSVFGRPLPGIAGTEPFFTIRPSDESNFDGYFKKNYNVFILLQRDRWNRMKDLFTNGLQQKIESKFNPDGLVVFKLEDVWAKPQRVHFILSPSEDMTVKTLQNKRGSLLQQALETECETTSVTLLDNKPEKDTFLNRMLEEKGYAIRKPITYRLSVSSEECTGIMRDMNGKRLGMYFYEEPYTDQKQFSSSYIIGRRNDVLGRHLTGSQRADSVPTFMSTDTVNVKLFRRQFELNGLYAIETRGWWEMENDYMAGPFVNYTVLDTKNNRVITMDGNIFAPGKEKGRLIRQLYVLASTFKLKE